MNSKKYYVVDALDSFNKGWVNVNFRNGKSALIPCGTSLCLTRNEFIITNGFYKGVTLKNKQDFHFLNSLKNKLPEIKKIKKIYLDQNKKSLTINKDTYNLSSGFFPILKNGLYDIECPEYPHTKKTKRIYLKENENGSRFAETWFEISYPYLKRGYYLHPGEISEGCLTVSIKNNNLNWNKIYFGLIFNEYNSVKIAKLEVV